MKLARIPRNAGLNRDTLTKTDGMRTLSKSAAILATAWIAGSALPALAQDTSAKPAAKKAAAKAADGKAQPKAQAKVEPKKSEPKAAAKAAEPKAAAAKAPEPVERPEPAHKPLETELAHIARYDAAIAPLRDLAFSNEEHPKAICRTPGRRATRSATRRRASWLTGISSAPATARPARFAPSWTQARPGPTGVC